MNFFANLNNSKTWGEYINNVKYASYRLFLYNSNSLILQNIKDNNSYVALTKTGYSKGSLQQIRDPKAIKVPGSWFIKPIYKHRKYIINLLFSFKRKRDTLNARAQYHG